VLAVEREMKAELVHQQPGQEADIGKTALEDIARHRRRLRRTAARRLDHRAAVLQHLEARPALRKAKRAAHGNDLAARQSLGSRNVNHPHRDTLVEAKPRVVDRPVTGLAAPPARHALLALLRRSARGILHQPGQQTLLHGRVDGQEPLGLRTEELALEPGKLLARHLELLAQRGILREGGVVFLLQGDGRQRDRFLF